MQLSFIGELVNLPFVGCFFIMRVISPFPKEKLSEMIDYYDGGNKSLREVSERFNVPALTIYGHFKKNNIDTKMDYMRNGNRIRKYQIDETYFEKINTRNKAYVFGWLMSDGGMNDSGSCYQIRLKISDIDILNEIKKELGYKRENYVIPKGGINHKGCELLVISNMKMFEDLIKLGCTPRKSLTKKFPSSIPSEFMLDFIRGYFDGNGCLHITNNHGSAGLEIKICTSMDFSIGLGKYLESIGIHCNLDRDKRTSIGTGQVRIRRMKDCVMFLEFIYTNLDGTLFLQRKRDKYLKYQELKNK